MMQPEKAGDMYGTPLAHQPEPQGFRSAVASAIITLSDNAA
jgi:hypothetical protein